MERAESADKSSPAKKQRVETACPHGNYLNYYSQRQSGADDARLAVLQAAWFEGKTCIDLGCNDGTFTRQIAATLGCRLMVGVDSDARLINAAWARTPLLGGAEARPCCWLRADMAAEDADLAGSLGPAAAGTFDTVTCFSVSKWVHLVRGDAGLVRFFQRVFALLKPGGRY